MIRADVCIRGTGIVGRSLALALSRQGFSVALHGADERPKPSEDVRAYALNAASVALLAELKVWGALPEDAATAVYDMHVEGDAPGAAVDFSAWQQGVEALAWIVDAAALEDALAAALRFAPHVQHAGDQPVQAPLTALCEGRDSAGRAERGVQWSLQPYGQRAVAANTYQQFLDTRNIVGGKEFPDAFARGLGQFDHALGRINPAGARRAGATGGSRGWKGPWRPGA